MAKALLKNYRIAGDIIDQVSQPESGASVQTDEPVVVSFPNLAGSISAKSSSAELTKSPPVGPALSTEAQDETAADDMPEAPAAIVSFFDDEDDDLFGEPEPLEEARLFADVAARYEKELSEWPKARAFLEARGLWVPEALKRFRVGYSGGGLGAVVSGRQRTNLVSLGLLKRDGSEGLEGCITFPSLDEDGRVVGFSGVPVDRQGIDGGAELYLPSAKKGIAGYSASQGLVNREAARVYRDRVILTASVMDALALECSGLHNAIPCYGPNGYTAAHEKLLRDERVKTVAVSFSSSEENAARMVIERLVKAGFKACAVEPPETSLGTAEASLGTAATWLDFVRNGGKREQAEQAIEAAATAAKAAGSGASGTPGDSPSQDEGCTPGVEGEESSASASAEASAEAEYTVTSDETYTVFTIGELKYRVSGVPALFATSLRVQLRVSYGEGVHYDGLDLYSARARTSFSSALARLWGVELARVGKDLVRILEHFERERDERLRGTLGKSQVVVSPEDRELGLGLLRDPRLFERIAGDLTELGYVGEELNKELLYLCASSRKLPDPMSVLIVSQSASGKSYLVDSVKKLIPDEDVVAVTSLSDQALNYIEDLTHKFLVLGEAVHGEVVEHQIREMLSGKELSRLVTVKDPETGKMASRVVRRPVIVSSVMSTTNYAVNPENASRCFVINTDESRNQTARIHEAQRHKYSLERLRGRAADVKKIVRTHQAAQRLLKQYAIVNEFAPLLDFPTSLMRLRRDHDRFLDLIAAVCFLRQYQKEPRCEGETEYLVCDMTDYEIAFRIMVEGVLAGTVRELPKSAEVVYEELRAWVRKEAERQELRPEELTFTQRQVREATGLGHTWVKRNLRELVDYEYVNVARGGSERSKAYYRLREDAELAAVDLSMIPTPQAMRAKLTECEHEGLRYRGNEA